jgi:5-formyltetrahydrofolate cyclo-ligase
LIVAPWLCYTLNSGIMTKKQLRTQMIDTLTRLSPALVEQKSGQIYERLVSLTCFRQAAVVLTYLSMIGEVATRQVVALAQNAGKRVFAPRITGDELEFHLLPEQNTDLEYNSYGIAEPPAGRPLFNPAGEGNTVLIITPGLAFDRAKQRLGRGRGYYDRFLARLRTHNVYTYTILGVCFSEQLLPAVPADEHDIPMDMVMTEREII